MFRSRNRSLLLKIVKTRQRNVSGCSGALDTTQIKVKPPSDEKPQYCTRKGNRMTLRTKLLRETMICVTRRTISSGFHEDVMGWSQCKAVEGTVAHSYVLDVFLLIGCWVGYGVLFGQLCDHLVFCSSLCWICKAVEGVQGLVLGCIWSTYGLDHDGWTFLLNGA